MEEHEDKPYRVEYAKSGRSKCKVCKVIIEKDHLRLAVMIQSPLFDGKQPNWYHMNCFFVKQRPKIITDIDHFESIRWEDQEKIKAKLESVLGTAAPKSVKSKSIKSSVNKDFNVEYAKSGRATCCGCQEKIVKEDIRVGKMDFESEEARRFGGINRWYHLECFVKLREELGFLEVASSLGGFLSLKADDKINIKKLLPAITTKDINIDKADGPSSSKKLKFTDTALVTKHQNKLMFMYRDNLKTLNMNALKDLLEYNKQEIPVSNLGAVLDRLSDIMAFGTLLPCDECNGQFVFKSGVGYQCLGYKNEWLKCEKVLSEPPREEFKIPSSLLKKIEFFKKYKCKIQNRSFILNDKTDVKQTSSTVTSETSKTKLIRVLPLKNMEFTTLMKGPELKNLKLKLPKFGGILVSQCTENVAAVFASQDSIGKKSIKLKEAEEFNIEVVEPTTFLDAIEKGSNAIELIVEKNIAPWGGKPEVRIERRQRELEIEHINKINLKIKMQGKSMFQKSMPTSVKLTLKGGVAVEPQSGLEHKAHVLKDENVTWNANLCLSDVQTGKNSYFKIQILKADIGNSYWIFRSWGRIGTTIGGFKTIDCETLEESKNLFRAYYEEQTGNSWGHTKEEFVKMPGKKVPVDIDYGRDEKQSFDSITNIPSKLPDPVQRLIRLIFDVENMIKVMCEFELDLRKMPLGNLSCEQLQKAYATLNNLSSIINSNDDKVKKEKCIEITNKFYTLIPHDFGMKTPQLINSKEILNSKLEMIGSLMEIQIAYDMMEYKTVEKSTIHPLDTYYIKLNCKIDLLEKTGMAEFDIISQYLYATHAETHSSYSLSIKDVFRVNRTGEKERFKPFKKLYNHKLLWHGSRITNYAAILSQGLRIAPVEAPVTGYMFGKGIYFADMVSKSANYCMASLNNNTGLLLLCDVALGNMYELQDAEYIMTLPLGKHSVMGIGRTRPDPKGSIKLMDRIQVPLGKPVPSNFHKSTLLYNEYVVYDVAQVKICYLVEVEFNFKYF